MALNTATLVLVVFTVCILAVQIHCSSTSDAPTSTPVASASTDATAAPASSTDTPTTTVASSSSVTPNTTTTVSATTTVAGGIPASSNGGDSNPTTTKSTNPGDSSDSSATGPTTTPTPPATTEKPVCYNQTCQGNLTCINATGVTCNMGKDGCFQKVSKNGTYHSVDVGCAAGTCVSVDTTTTGYTETMKCCLTSRCNDKEITVVGKSGSSTRIAGVAMTIISVLLVMLS